MKFPEICFIKFRIDDLNFVETVKDRKGIDLRRKIDILVIDDEDFSVAESLKSNNFRLTYRKDVENVTDVCEYQIILCDIRGVGKKLQSTYEGAFLIKEIKENYPLKKVVAYTASQYDPTYNRYLESADAVVSKGLAIEDWVTLLDEQIASLIDPVAQWKNLREQLFKKNAATIDVAKLENAFVRACKSNSFSSFEKLANTMSPEVTKAISEFVSSVAVKLITKE